MADKQRTQRTQPKKGKPVEIPVPKRSDFDNLLDRAEKRPADKLAKPPGKPRQKKAAKGG